METSTLIAGNGSCSTYYTLATTTICATSLTGIATRIIVSECDQQSYFI